LVGSPSSSRRNRLAMRLRCPAHVQTPSTGIVAPGGLGVKHFRRRGRFSALGVGGLGHALARGMPACAQRRIEGVSTPFSNRGFSHRRSFPRREGPVAFRVPWQRGFRAARTGPDGGALPGRPSGCQGTHSEPSPSFVTLVVTETDVVTRLCAQTCHDFSEQARKIRKTYLPRPPTLRPIRRGRSYTFVRTNV